MVNGAAAKAAWVERVLGVAIGEAGGAPVAEGAPGLDAVAATWRQASDAVDQQIGTLAAKLRTFKHPDLDDIAEYGLNALTGGHKVKVLAGLAGARSGSPADRAKLGTAVDAFIAHLTTNPKVAAADANPFDVEVSIRGTLLPALDDMRRMLAA